MTFANPQDDIDHAGTITQTWWPDIMLSDAQAVMRVPGNVTGARLIEALQAAVWAVNRELTAWALAQEASGVAELQDARAVGLYRRAVYFTAKAELAGRYRDYDLTGAASTRADAQDDIADEARRIVRWAISDLLGKPRTTVHAL